MNAPLGCATDAWLELARRILTYGNEVGPRGYPTLEVLNSSVSFDMTRPFLVAPLRKPFYRFMAAEPLWILSGSDRVADIAPYNRHLASFSDDGKKFFGAYGPPVVDQLPWVVRKLIEDRASRQAVLTIWRPKPPSTKDVPCTVALGFSIRADRLHAFVTMRSSDTWLGVPYDLATFSVIAAKVATLFNQAMNRVGDDIVCLGDLHFTAWSSHLYDRNREATERCLGGIAVDPGPALPLDAIHDGDWLYVAGELERARDDNRIPFRNAR